jgi:predicted NBD/HSP70 family sugar kinase
VDEYVFNAKDLKSLDRMLGKPGWAFPPGSKVPITICTKILQSMERAGSARRVRFSLYRKGAIVYDASVLVPSSLDQQDLPITSIYLAAYIAGALAAIGASEVYIDLANKLFERVKKLLFDKDFLSVRAVQDMQRLYGGLEMLAQPKAIDAPHLDLTPSAVDFNPQSGVLLGLDIGATEIKGVIIHNGAVDSIDPVETDLPDDPDPTWNADRLLAKIDKAYGKLLQKVHSSRVDAVGISWPGPVEPFGSIENARMQGNPKVLRCMIPLGEREKFIKEFYKWCQDKLRRLCDCITLHNDGYAAAFGAMMMLSPRRCRNGIFLGFGTSLASAYIADNGQISDHLAELGKVPYDLHPAAYQYRQDGQTRGLLRCYLSSRAVESMAKHAGLDKHPRFAARKKPFCSLDVRDLLRTRLKAQAEEIYRTIGAEVALASIHLKGFFPKVQRIILGGAVVEDCSGKLIMKEAKALLQQVGEHLQILRPEGPKLLGAIGAAQLANRERQERTRTKGGSYE